LFDLLVDGYFLSLVLPLGEFLLVKLLFEFGLKSDDFLLIGLFFLYELLGTSVTGAPHSIFITTTLNIIQSLALKIQETLDFIGF